MLGNKLNNLESLNSSSKGSLTSAVSWLVVILVLTPFLIYGVPQIVGAKESLIVLSGSMEPDIPTGSVITVYPADPAELEEGDVITFEHDYTRDDGVEYTTHRIVEVTQERGEHRFRTKGDANDSPDPGTVAEGDVVGVHGFTIPYLGYLIERLDSPIAFIGLVAIPAALIILNELWNITKELSKSRSATSTGKVVGMASLAISFIIFGMSAATFTGLLPELAQQAGTSVSFGPTEFGAAIMGSILISMVVLKFL